MPLVILQPCSNNISKGHYNETINNSIYLGDVQHLISEKEHDDLSKIYPDSKLRIWGVTPGKGNSVNITRWERIQPGDVTLFSAKGKVFASAIATYKTHNSQLAEKLWGHNNEGQTWEYIYFVSETTDTNIPYQTLNKVIPYADNYVIQGSTVLNSTQSGNVLKTFDLESETFFPDVNINEYLEELKNEDSLDSQTLTQSRKEQWVLRRMLFKNNPISSCCICGEKLPVNFLVAAHIKKRADCTLDEKKDFNHIVAPMCKMGCDELYEKGFIGVENKNVVRLKNTPSFVKITNYLNTITGKTCSHWNKKSEKYFLWHIAKHRTHT